MSYYANIEGHSGYVKDKRTGAVLNTNNEEIEAAKKRKADRLNKDKEIADLKNIIVKTSKLDETQVWVYIIDLPPSQMIEYGAVLPESGREKQWFMGLSNKLKKKLSALEK